MTCEQCQQPTLRLIICDTQLLCPTCREIARGEAPRHATAVIGDDIPGGFVQEHFGHTPETFYSKKAMLKRATELGLQPFVRHVDGSTQTKRWI